MLMWVVWVVFSDFSEGVDGNRCNAGFIRKIRTRGTNRTVRTTMKWNKSACENECGTHFV